MKANYCERKTTVETVGSLYLPPISSIAFLPLARVRLFSLPLCWRWSAATAVCQCGQGFRCMSYNDQCILYPGEKKPQILYFNLCCGRFSKLVFLSRDIGSSREVAQPIIRLAAVVATRHNVAMDNPWTESKWEHFDLWYGEDHDCGK